MAIEVTSAVRDALLAEARAAHPLECCGLLFGSDQSIAAHRPVANVHPAPHGQFEVDPQALIDAHRAARQGGPRLVGYYHSHPSGSLEPSATDRARAAGDGMIWAIVTRDALALWRAGQNGFSALSYTTL
jgi:proteasome lid subunit RPN8/RPN11